jgi:hypothetical protein
MPVSSRLAEDAVDEADGRKVLYAVEAHRAQSSRRKTGMRRNGSVPHTPASTGVPMSHRAGIRRERRGGAIHSVGRIARARAITFGWIEAVVRPGGTSIWIVNTRDPVRT